jgi:ribonuclease P protein subunit RPR2
MRISPAAEDREPVGAPAPGEEPSDPVDAFRPALDERLRHYARDLRDLLAVERRQRRRLEDAYRETVAVLATALESKDLGTRAHSQRVQRYAAELALLVEPDVAADPSAEYGFLLHDVGKIGIPDSVLRKPGPLDEAEARLMRRHTIFGEEMLAGVALLYGRGMEIVRSHHERWDGRGYPDALSGEEIPLCARVFAVADSLDAITTDRPYHTARPWLEACQEILREAGRQFDPLVVDVFRAAEPALLEAHRELVAA